MKVKSLKAHPYGGRYHAKGTEYDISKKKDLLLLAGIKLVQIVEEKPPIINDDKNPVIAEKEEVVPVEQESTNDVVDTVSGSSYDQFFGMKKRGRKKKNEGTYDRKDMQSESSY